MSHNAEPLGHKRLISFTMKSKQYELMNMKNIYRVTHYLSCYNQHIWRTSCDIRMCYCSERIVNLNFYLKKIKKRFAQYGNDPS